MRAPFECRHRAPRHEGALRPSRGNGAQLPSGQMPLGYPGIRLPREGLR